MELDSKSESQNLSNLSDWTLKEVKNWFSLPENQVLKEDFQFFKELTGKELAEMTKQNFIEKSPKFGNLIYFALQNFKSKIIFFFKKII